MPPRRRQVTRRRRFSLETLGRLELQRWDFGAPVVEGFWTPSATEREGAYQPLVWTAWAELFETYEILREEYLARYAERRRHLAADVPGIELLHRAWLRGENPADVAVPMPADPRPLLGVS